MIESKNLFKYYTSVKAVDDISLTAKPGKILGLIGPNGAGKTTTIRMLLNIIFPDKGEIFFNGKLFSPEIKNRIGYLPEERGLYQKNKILDVMLYLSSLRNVETKIAKQNIYDWLKRFNMLDTAKRKVEELSKGNQQKIQFIISLLHDPDFIILDEPFSGLDPINQILMKDILQELKQNNKTVIFSTHQMESAEKLCDEICLINKGKIVENGEISEVKRKFRTNNFKIDFVGNGSFLSSLPELKNIILFENSAECEMTENVKIDEIISLINSKVEIRKFEIVEPSLQSIFLKLVGTIGSIN